MYSRNNKNKCIDRFFGFFDLRLIMSVQFGPSFWILAMQLLDVFTFEWQYTEINLGGRHKMTEEFKLYKTFKV